MIISLETVTEDMSNQRSLAQFMMNQCWKQDEIDEHMNMVCTIVDTYNIMDLKIKKELLKCFKKHCR